MNASLVPTVYVTQEIKHSIKFNTLIYNHQENVDFGVTWLHYV